MVQLIPKQPTETFKFKLGVTNSTFLENLVEMVDNDNLQNAVIAKFK